MTVTFQDMSHGGSLPWTEKYRPRSLNQVLGHADVLNTLKGFVATGSLPHILLHGPPGTGKTTIVKALAFAVYGSRAQSMVLELNASDERGINTVRETIKEFTSTGKMATFNSIDTSAEFHDSPMTQLKLVVLDEADQMTKDAQMALRRIIELYSGTCRFFVMCNYMNKLIPALQSRCTKFRMPPLTRECVTERIMEIAEAEQLELSQDGVNLLIKLSNGDMRKVVNLMEASKRMGTGLDHLSDALGFPTKALIAEVKAALLEKSFAEAHETIMNVKRRFGYRLIDILEEVYESCVQDDFPFVFMAILIPRLGAIQLALNEDADEDFQAANLVAAFVEAKFALNQSTKQS